MTYLGEVGLMHLRHDRFNRFAERERESPSVVVSFKERESVALMVNLY